VRAVGRTEVENAFAQSDGSHRSPVRSHERHQRIPLELILYGNSEQIEERRRKRNHAHRGSNPRSPFLSGHVDEEGHMGDLVMERLVEEFTVLIKGFAVI
jgi:hypothetical protein